MEARHLSPEAYLAFDAASPQKHEYWHGRVIAMAGAEPDHNDISSNLMIRIGSQLNDGCRIVSSDQRVQLDSSYVYPDLVITCGPRRYDDSRPRTLLNPTAVIEIISPSTSDRDRRDKMTSYLRLASLREYWIVETAFAQVTQYAKHKEAWIAKPLTGRAAQIESPHFGVTLTLAEIYRGLDEIPDETDWKGDGPLEDNA
ncbi:MAG: Uma2 family endonuclease [Rhodothermales bacterium]